MRCAQGRLFLSLTILLILLPQIVAAGELPAIGTVAPEFRLMTNEGKEVALQDYHGQWVVLYFYPKNFTSGCTLEARNFQRDLAQYKEVNAVILGVSVDSVTSHRDFCDQESLDFTLLSDPGAQVSARYGSVMDYQGATLSARNTFIIDPVGKIAEVFTKVSPSGHSQQVLDALAERQKR